MNNEMTMWMNEYEWFKQDVNGTQWDSYYDEQNTYYEQDDLDGQVFESFL